ncbi:MAG: hypothetical protein ACJ8C4_06695 [Gemmataceae bacterium]
MRRTRTRAEPAIHRKPECKAVVGTQSAVLFLNTVNLDGLSAHFRSIRIAPLSEGVPDQSRIYLIHESELGDLIAALNEVKKRLKSIRTSSGRKS